MERIIFGRRKFSIQDGQAILTSTSVTERSKEGETEGAFTQRLLLEYGAVEGTIEIVYKAGRPDYAIVTFS
ncbi:MAG: hypothetical protein ACRDHL_06215 [Candidatus Promineifilaceae bacterium]